MQGGNRDADIENRLVHPAGEEEGGTNGESGIETYILPQIKQRASRNLLYDTGTPTWCSVTTRRGGMGWQVGGRFQREDTYTYL